MYNQLAGVLAAPGGAVAAGPTPLGRGLVATQQVTQGATLLSVDWANMLCVTDQPKLGDAFGRRVLGDWQMLHGRLPPLLVRYLVGDEGDWFVRLAAWLLWLRRNAQGPWRLYIDLLPREEEITTLMNYRPEEVGELQSPLLESRAALERSQIAGLHDRLFCTSGGELRALQLAAGLQDTVWAACMVNSRSFSETVEGETVSLMVPCADMANHALAPNASYQFVAPADAFQLQALQDIARGAEACISYGCTHKSNEGLMRDYGFVVPGNLNDRVPFSAGKQGARLLALGGCDDVASQLAARAAGLGAMAQPSISAPRLLEALGLGGEAGGSFDLTAAAAAAMGDSEADAARRRLLATLMSLQPFLRDIPPAGSTASAAAAAAAAAGAAPPLSEAELQRERQSSAALVGQCQQLLAGMPTTVETDEALLAADGGGGERLGARRRQAVATRVEAKRLLRAAEAALQAYAAALR
ncbi:hypothetical protein CHLNCDRAFT_136721 [Chlorella variabilis]|uniref:SET domain-containing protein n=1 Tax=Chlorella variabilis TaxID=554065 RepID=E1ZKX8_CHLVA|nr:hypothetical protein CHLNCDRAFT_136721 [Chlorella variabilis]EFN53459.1 hypothetical protein CHLNCDRAFT_136721 [Chlorella variabilis]|eukprot:XP_005845561.1 hypothetical protein CHLNCDRAFT_136721 [Chlorella variabilis]